MEQKIFFESSGVELAGILSVVNKNKPVIILCHGFMTNKSGSTNTELKNRLNNNGINTFCFDFYGSGDSKGNFENITLTKAVQNIMDAIALLKKRFTKIGLFGSSFGAAASILATSRSKDIYLLALSSPPSDYTETYIQILGKKGMEDWKKTGAVIRTNRNGEKYKVNYSFYEDFIKYNIYEAEKMIDIPVIIVHGSNDEIVSVKQSIIASRLIPNCRLEIIDSADHIYTNTEHFEKRIGLIADFIASQVSN